MINDTYLESLDPSLSFDATHNNAYFTHEWLKSIWREKTEKSFSGQYLNFKEKITFLENWVSALSYDTSFRKNELGITKFCLFKVVLALHNLIKRIRFHWLLPYQQTKLTKDLTPFRWQSAVDERLHAWLIVNETELKRRLSSGKRWKIICEHYSFLLCKCGRKSVKTCSLKSMALQMPSYST